MPMIPPIDVVTRPLTEEEAVALLVCFGPDDAFGLAWTLLHLIEATPGGVPIAAMPQPSDNECYGTARIDSITAFPEV